MIYYVVFILVIILLWASTNLMGSRGRKAFFVLSALFVILFQGLRSFTVGVDLKIYIPSYTSIGLAVPYSFSMKWQNFEMGYVLLNKLLFSLGLDSRWFLIIVTALIQAPIFYTLYRHSEIPLLSVFVYFAFGNFAMTFTGLRQALAMGLCFFAYNFVKKRKIICFCLTILLAATFHESALFCLLIYPIYRLKIPRRAFPLMVLIVAVCFLFKNQIYGFATKLYYGKAKGAYSNNAYTMFAMYFLLYALANFVGNDANDRDYIGLRNLMFLNVLIFSMATTSDIFTRLGYPITLYTSLFVPKFIKRIANVNNKWHMPLRIACYGLCLAVFFRFMNATGTIPFSFMGTEY